MKQYEDMLYLPHPTSKKYPRMSRRNRAAQFAPFSALAGLDTAIEKTKDMVEYKAEQNIREEIDFP